MRESWTREAKVMYVVSERAHTQIFCLHCAQLFPLAPTAGHTVFGKLHQPLKTALLLQHWSVRAVHVVPSDCALTMCQTLYQVLYVYNPQSHNSSASLESFIPFTSGETEAQKAQGPWTKTRHLVNAGIYLHTQIGLTPKYIQFCKPSHLLSEKKCLWVPFCYNWGNHRSPKTNVDES